ncbi:ead/Ea22-like family protein [Klebsiella pneumoniae]|uniref:ead/Ea22-like family protein n=2 Tax=Klebsiella pneumoniae TaxID=573 RepID=UPI0035B0DA80
MTDITELAQSLKAAAEKATPGEWVYFPKNTSIEYDVGSDESQGSILYVDSGDFTQPQTDRNGEFIALANPANVLALVEALEKAQQRISQLESRTVTVKLPPHAPENLACCLDGYETWLIATTFRDTWNKCLEEVMRTGGAGIKWEAE